MSQRWSGREKIELMAQQKLDWETAKFLAKAHKPSQNN